MEFIILIAIYLLPTFIAAARSKANGGSIFVINLLLGWTLIGWAVALAWSVAEDKPRSERAK